MCNCRFSIHFDLESQLILLNDSSFPKTLGKVPSIIHPLNFRLTSINPDLDANPKILRTTFFADLIYVFFSVIHMPTSNISSVDVMAMTVKNIFSAKIMYNIHCVKSVQIRSYFWSAFFCIQTQYGEMLHFSPRSVRIQKNMDQK